MFVYYYKDTEEYNRSAHLGQVTLRLRTKQKAVKCVKRLDLNGYIYDYVYITEKSLALGSDHLIIDFLLPHLVFEMKIAGHFPIIENLNIFPTRIGRVFFS